MSESSPNQGSELALSTHEKARAQLGDWLRQARENTGLSIEAISQETKISKLYIVSLESGQLEALPGKVFGRGFVKNISRLLRSDAGECLRLYDACWQPAVESQTNADAAGVTENEVEVHKTKSVRARIAEPVDTTSVVARRLITEDFAAAGEKPRVPRISKSSNIGLKLKLPSWIVRGVVSPHVRLWILAGIAMVFVLLVFGRWAAGTIHKSRLSMSAHKGISTSAVSSAELAVGDGGKVDQNLALPISGKSLSSVAKIDASSTRPGLDAGNLGGKDVKAENVVALENARPLANDEDNPLYMPSAPSAAFEQVLEMNVAGNVEVRLTLDGKRVEKSWFEPETYRFTFNNKAEVYILDASQVNVIYNGKSLGVLGSQGRKRRIVFQAKASQDDFPQQ